MLELLEVGDLDVDRCSGGQVAHRGGEDIRGFGESLQQTRRLSLCHSLGEIGFRLFFFFDYAPDNSVTDATGESDDGGAIMEREGVPCKLDVFGGGIDEVLSYNSSRSSG